MTTETQLKQEAARLAARLNFTTDPTNQRIVAAALRDVLETLKQYPTGLIWFAGESESK